MWPPLFDVGASRLLQIARLIFGGAGEPPLIAGFAAGNGIALVHRMLLKQKMNDYGALLFASGALAFCRACANRPDGLASPGWHSNC